MGFSVHLNVQLKFYNLPFLNKEEDCINRKYNEVKSVYQSEFEKWTVKKGEADSKLKEVIKLLPEFHDRNSQEIGTLYQEVTQQKARLEPLKSKQDGISKKIQDLRQKRLNLIEDYKSSLDDAVSKIKLEK